MSGGILDAFRLDDRVAIVTGSGRGIGAATASAFARNFGVIFESPGKFDATAESASVKLCTSPGSRNTESMSNRGLRKSGGENSIADDGDAPPSSCAGLAAADSASAHATQITRVYSPGVFRGNRSIIGGVGATPY